MAGHQLPLSSEPSPGKKKKKQYFFVGFLGVKRKKKCETFGAISKTKLMVDIVDFYGSSSFYLDFIIDLYVHVFICVCKSAYMYIETRDQPWDVCSSGTVCFVF